MKVSKFCTFEINLLGQIFSIVMCVWFPCPYEDLDIKKNKQTNKHLQGRILKWLSRTFNLSSRQDIIKQRAIIFWKDQSKVCNNCNSNFINNKSLKPEGVNVQMYKFTNVHFYPATDVIFQKKEILTVTISGRNKCHLTF